MMAVCTTAALSEASLANGFCAGLIPVNVDQPRSIIAVGTSNFLTLERGTGSVLFGEDLNGDGIPETLRKLVSVAGLNHGLAVTATHLYASTDTEVYRWPYNTTTNTLVGGLENVIFNMNADGNGGAPSGHKTRTLAIKNDELYVSVGSNQNIDKDSFRARIRRFNIGNPALFPFGKANARAI
jgi:glucose/arabinose dehydrogenase